MTEDRNNYIKIDVKKGDNTPSNLSDFEEIVEEKQPSQEQPAEVKEEPSQDTPKEDLVDEKPKEDKDASKEEATEKPEKKEEAKKKSTKEKQKPSRSQERIRALANEKNELKAQLEEMEAKQKELEEKLSTGTKTSKESLKSSLEAQVEAYSKQLSEAIQNGESDLVVQIQDKMMDTKMELAGLKAELYQIEEQSAAKEKEASSKPKEQPKVEVPQEAYDWIDAHPEFETDPIFNASALTLNNILIQEGYDPNTSDFYEELDARLSPRFPELFGKSEENVVQSNKESSTNTSGEEDVKQETPEKSAPKQTVAGASRASSNTYGGKGGRKANSEVVDFTAQDLEHADRWGLDIQRLAERVVHADKNRTSDGYVPVFTNKKK